MYDTPFESGPGLSFDHKGDAGGFLSAQDF